MLTPEQIIERLEQIEQDLADVGPEFSDAAEAWTRAKRDKEKSWAEAYMSASVDGKSVPVTDKKAAAIAASEHIGVESEARYVGCKAKVDVLETRSMIGMALLKSHGRVDSGFTPTGRTYGSERAPS